MNEIEIYKKINLKTKAVFITYAQGFNGLTDKLIKTLKKKSIKLLIGLFLHNIIPYFRIFGIQTEIYERFCRTRKNY